MATDVYTFNSDDFGLAYKAPHISQAVNLALAALPKGIWRGFRPSTAGSGFLVNLGKDPNTSDHVAMARTSTGEQIVVRTTDTLQIDLAAAAGTTVVVVLQVVYSTSSTTTAKLVAMSLAEYGAATGIVPIFRCAVPGSGPITAAQITPQYRIPAVLDIGPDLSWSPLVKNPGFEIQTGALSTTLLTKRLPGWWTAKADGSAFSAWGATLVASTHSGSWMARAVISTGVIEDLRMAVGEEGVGRSLFPVAPGSYYYARCVARCVTSATNTSAGLLLRFWDQAGTSEITSVTIALATTSGASFAEYVFCGRVPSTAHGDATSAYHITAELKFASTSAVSNAGEWYVDEVQVWAQTVTAGDARIDAYDALRGRALVLGDPASTDEFIVQSSSTELFFRARNQSADRTVRLGEENLNKRLDLTVSGSLDVAETVVVDDDVRVADDLQAGDMMLQQDSHAMTKGSCVQLIDSASSASPTGDYVFWYRTIHGFALKAAPWSALAALSGSPSAQGGPYVPSASAGTWATFVLDLGELLASACAGDTPYTTLDQVDVVLLPKESTYTGATAFAAISVLKTEFLAGAPGTSTPTSVGSASTNGTTLNSAHPNTMVMTCTLGTPQVVSGTLLAGVKVMIMIETKTEVSKNGPEIIAVELKGKTYRIAPN